MVDGARPAKIAPARYLCSSLGKLIIDICQGKRTALEIAKDLDKLSRYAAGITPKEAKPKEDTTASEDEVFAYWAKATGKTGSRFTPERRLKIRARLKNYSVADIKTAIEFVANDPFYSGENASGKTYQDLELICRNDTKLEEFIDRAKEAGISKPVAAVDTAKVEALEAAQQDASDALEKGDTDGYNRAQERIKNLKRR